MSMERGIACASFYARLVRRGYGVLIGDPPTQRSFTLAQKKKAENHLTDMCVYMMHSDIFREITLATRAFSET